MQQILKELVDTKDNINIGLSQEHRAKLVEMLAQLLADEHILYIKLRNYHWNIEGMYFQQLHELFSEQYNALESSIDDIAERIRTLGYYAPGSMKQFVELARLSETGHLSGSDTQMLQNILADHEMIIQVLRHNVEEADKKYNDMGTADFLTGLMEGHEKMAWMIRSHLA